MKQLGKTAENAQLLLPVFLRPRVSGDQTCTYTYRPLASLTTSTRACSLCQSLCPRGPYIIISKSLPRSCQACARSGRLGDSRRTPLVRISVAGQVAAFLQHWGDWVAQVPRFEVRLTAVQPSTSLMSQRAILAELAQDALSHTANPCTTDVGGWMRNIRQGASAREQGALGGGLQTCMCRPRLAAAQAPNSACKVGYRV